MSYVAALCSYVVLLVDFIAEVTNAVKGKILKPVAVIDKYYFLSSVNRKHTNTKKQQNSQWKTGKTLAKLAKASSLFYGAQLCSET